MWDFDGKYPGQAVQLTVGLSLADLCLYLCNYGTPFAIGEGLEIRNSCVQIHFASPIIGFDFKKNKQKTAPISSYLKKKRNNGANK